VGNPIIDLVVAIVALCGLIGVLGLLRSSLYERIGEAGVAPEPRSGPWPGSPAAAAERELEIRQMLIARSERRLRRGEPPLDVEGELASLLAAGAAPERALDLPSPGSAPPGPAADPRAGREGADTKRHDPELVEELRQLAQARNARRLRRGEQPLDVRAEVERALAELDR
jgi:hypothetical protein